MISELARSLVDLEGIADVVNNEVDDLLDNIIEKLREISIEIDELESIESVEDVEDIKLSLSSKIDGLISDLY